MSHTTTSTLVAQTDCIAATVKKSPFQQSRNPLYLAYRCGEKVVRKFGSFKTIADICIALHNNQREQLANEAGIFYTRLYRFRTPLSVLNGPTAGYSVERRVGTKPFYLHIVKLS